MFGMHYQHRDDEVAGRRGRPAETPGGFACALLAELLNRSHALEVAYRRVYETEGGIPGDHDEALQDLARVVEPFLRDLEEARCRGLRARAFSRNGLDQVTADGVSDDPLLDLGGELVSTTRALAEA